MSYLKFYSLKEPPFSNVTDLRYFYSSPAFKICEDKIITAVENHKQLVSVYGKCGLGKTVLSRRLLNNFELFPDKYEVMLLVCIHSDVDAAWLLQKLGRQLHLELPAAGKSEYFEKLAESFEKLCEHGKQIVIIMDEASKIENMEVFEELRGLIDFMSDNKYGISVIIFGLPGLEDKIAGNPPLFQRIESRIVLTEFSDALVTKSYMEHRLRVAGAAEPIFTEKAYNYIHFSAKGNPRLINIIADNSLLEGYLLKNKQLDEKEVERVMIEMGYNTRLKSLFLDS